MYTIATNASSREVEAILSTPLGGRRAQYRADALVNGDGSIEDGVILVTVPEWAASSLMAGLRRLKRWVDRAPRSRPRMAVGRPIVAAAAAATIRPYKAR